MSDRFISEEVNMTLSFKDYFSQQAADYAKYRPHYPEALFKYLAEKAPNHETAWDCGTGNGQVALSLTNYFQQVYATDASADQIAQAFQHTKIQYQVATAEQTALGDRVVDLVTVGQALHWFNLEQFYQEVRRVVKPQGIIAIWCYGFFKLPAAEIALNNVLQEFYTTVEPFWPPERELVNQQYRTIPFPFKEETVPAFAMTAEWNVGQLIGYLLTWSATQRFIAQNSDRLIRDLTNRLQSDWGALENTKLIQWPLHLRIGHI
jgi:ubiquinone/menaquinone biosynthesis C-methylase UbiE